MKIIIIVLTNFYQQNLTFLTPQKTPAGSRPQAFKNPAPQKNLKKKPAPQLRPQANAQP